MTTFVCTSLPFLRILDPDTGEYTQFVAGKLEVAEDDPAHASVMAEAIRNPAISIMVNSTTCRYCGAVHEGDKAKVKLEAHMKDAHFDLWKMQAELDAAAVIQREVKSRAGYACDVCQPTQTFGSEADLAAHARLVHATAPDLDDQGNTIGGGEDAGGSRRPGEVIPAGAPAARASTRTAGPSINDLRAQAKKLKVSAEGSKDQLAARIAAAKK